jgi:fructuronate reductase
MSKRLNDATLADLPSGIERPRYDRSAVTTGIVHLGVGAFHRAHQAVYTDDILARDPRWGIVAASLRSPDTYDALDPQGGLYAVSVRSREGEALRVIGAIRKVIVAPRAVDDLLDALADPQTRIVTLTVTEKGYCHDPATGALNEKHPTWCMTWRICGRPSRLRASSSKPCAAAAPPACRPSRCSPATISRPTDAR